MTTSRPGNDDPPPETPAASPPPAEDDFRWQAFFQRSTDPVFVLNRQCYLLFVNQAWERLAGLSLEQVARMSCRNPRPAQPRESWKTVLAHVLTPPDEVLGGEPGRYRRLVPGHGNRPPAWWDVDYFPLRDADGCRGVVGRITPVPTAILGDAPPLPEPVVAPRQRQVRRHQGVYLSERTPALRRLADQLRLAARFRDPVLLVGEPGSGKSTLARWIHLRGDDRERAFASLDCLRLPPQSVAALLLGEDGQFARAPLGTVYLGDPGNLPRDLQVRLAEEFSAEGVDSTSHPRLMAGCPRDPALEVRDGRLVEELAQSLATFRIDVPALRERRDDLPHLVDHFLRRLNDDGGHPVTTLTPDAWEVVLSCPWSGNLRELLAVLRAARLHSSSDAIDAADLPAHVRQAAQLGREPSSRLDRTIPLHDLLEQVERHLIELALRRTRGNKSRAAELLSMQRPHLFRRLKALGLDAGEE